MSPVLHRVSENSEAKKIQPDILRNLNVYCSYIQPYLEETPPHRRVLVIHAHPNTDSFSSSLLNATIRGLRDAGHEVRVRKLYGGEVGEDSYTKSAFPAALSQSERSVYNTPQLLHTMTSSNGEGVLANEVVSAVEDIRWCSALVFVYPTWWSGFPAVLKGYFDRVFLPGVSFRLPTASDASNSDKVLHVVACLRHIEKVGVVTCYGASAASVFASGDGGRRYLSSGIRPVFAPKCVLQWHALYSVDNSSLSQRERFMQNVYTGMKYF